VVSLGPEFAEITETKTSSGKHGKSLYKQQHIYNHYTQLTLPRQYQYYKFVHQLYCIANQVRRPPTIFVRAPGYYEASDAKAAPI